MLPLKARLPTASSKTSCNFKSGKPWSFTFRFKVRRRLTEAVKWWGEPIGIVTEIVPRFAFNLRHCPRTLAPSGQKNVRKGLDFFWEQSVTGPTSGSAKGSPGIPPRRLHCLCGASVVAAQAASPQQGIPTMSLKKLSSNNSRTDSKQAQVLAMLHSKQGATIATMMQATGWQPHSVRGFLTAVVRNKLGLTLVSKKTGEERVYRVVASDIPPKRKGRPGRKVA